MILTFLHRPYPAPSSRGKYVTPLAFAVFVTLFLFVFQPFGLSRLSRPIGWVTTGYGLVTFLVLFVEMWTLPRLFPAFFKESSWTVGREIAIVMLDVFLIGVCNLLYSAWALHETLNFGTVVWYQVVTLIIAILPLTIWVMYKQLRLQKRYMEEAHALDLQVQGRRQQDGERRRPEEMPLQERPENRPLQHGLNNAPLPEGGPAEGQPAGRADLQGLTAAPKPEQAPVTIPSEQAGEPLVLMPDQLLYIAAADNYIKIHHLEQGQVKQTLLRSSLKKAAAALEENPRLFRCHRTFLVNLDHVTEVSGNAQGYKLLLAHTGDWIPVSRSLHEAIRQKL